MSGNRRLSFQLRRQFVALFIESFVRRPLCEPANVVLKYRSRFETFRHHAKSQLRSNVYVDRTEALS